MKLENVKEAAEEAERFIKKYNDYIFAEQTKHASWSMTPKESGALKRASMDLTRALSKMRQEV